MAVTSHVGPTRAEPESSLGTQVPAQADIQRVTNCLEAEVTQVVKAAMEPGARCFVT